MEMKRVLLKLSGEALAGPKKTGFDEATCSGSCQADQGNVQKKVCRSVL